MLYYKAWLESRARFLAGAGVLSAYCLTFIQQARVSFPPVVEPALPYTAYVWRGVYDGPDLPVFVIVAAILGLGGLERERESGSHPFTLALPVTRSQLLWPRIAIAMCELITLAAIPLIVVPLASARIGHSYPVGHAARFALLYAATGALWLSASVLASVAFTGMYTSIVASIMTPGLCAAVFAGTALRHQPSLNPFNVMNGSRLPYLDRATDLIVGAMPWTTLMWLALISSALLGAAAAVAYRRDF